MLGDSGALAIGVAPNPNLGYNPLKNPAHQCQTEHAMSNKSITIIPPFVIDIGKNSFAVVGLDFG